MCITCQRNRPQPAPPPWPVRGRVCARLRSRRRWAIRIRIDDVGKTYGATKALTGVSTEIEPGTLVALIGLNGAGKTTLLNCLGGLVIPASGGIWFDDELVRTAEGWKIDARTETRAWQHNFPATFEVPKA